MQAEHSVYNWDVCRFIIIIFIIQMPSLIFGEGVVGGLSCLRGRDSSYCLEETKGVVTSLMFQK